MIPTLLRENLSRRTLPREPEPDLVMDSPEQVEAYALAGRIDGVMSASYLFHTARITQLIQGCEKVVDLGCGPATQLAQIAELSPDTHFTGVDLSPTMLADARAHTARLGLGNVAFVQDDISTLDSLPDACADAVISTMALHHLPRLELLEATFRNVRRILKPGGKVYLVDFGRPRSLHSVLFFAYMNRDHQPHIFSLDYERSLRAAFLPEEFSALTETCLPPGCKVFTPFRLPILVLITSPSEPLADTTLIARLKSMRQALPRRYRQQLDDFRLFFRIGGLTNDPFQ